MSAVRHYIFDPRRKMDDTLGSGRKDDDGKDESLQNMEENKDVLGENGTDYSESKSKRLARRATQCGISVNLSLVKMCILSGGFSSAKIGDEDACEFGRFGFHRPPVVGSTGVVIRPVEQWAVSSKRGRPSMSNILKSPLLQKFVHPSSNDVKRSISYDFMSSVDGLCNNSSHKLGSETPVSENRKYGSKMVHKRLVSMSIATSTCSDQSFSSTSTTISRGILQCTWNGGNPSFVFTLDNQREVYVADLSKEGSARGKGSDCMYLIRSSKGSHKEHWINDNDSGLVGKMKVSNSFSICPHGSKMNESEFVLFSGIETFDPVMKTSSHNHRKNKGVWKKMVEVFKSSHSSKPETMSKFPTTSLMEDSSWGPCQDTINNSDTLDTTNHIEEEFPPNLELTAIVVRNHLAKNPLPDVGGWGLKFLRKSGGKQHGETVETSVPCACALNSSDRSTSTDIIVPAGIHGGPRTRNDGPSSLIDRWRSGGHCDCGGWDSGCPLTVLKAGSSRERGLPSMDILGACKLFEFFVQGSKNGSPTLRIANVHDGLYNVHFQSTLSALQSFSIAVAHIHGQSPDFRPRNVKPSR